MTDTGFTPPRYTAEEWERVRQAFPAAKEADEKAGPDAAKWVDELPDLPLLDEGYTLAAFIAQRNADDEGSESS